MSPSLGGALVSCVKRAVPEREMNWHRQDYTQHSDCLSFHHIRLGGILVFPHNQEDFKCLNQRLLLNACTKTT